MLDLGCGHGAVIYFARELGYTNMRGVDGSKEQIAAAHRLGIPGVKQQDLMEAIRGEGDCSYDAVITFDVIEHFTRDELIDLVDSIQRVLRSGGRWIIHTINAGSPLFGTVRYGDLTHELAFTATSITQLLVTSGFVKVRAYEDRPVVHGLKSAVRWVAWKAIRAVLRSYLAVETGSAGRSTILSQNFLVVAYKPS